MQKYILLADRRTGTTLMIDYLERHPRIECIKRAFGIEERVDNPTPDRHSGLFYLYRTATWPRRCLFYLRRRKLIEDFLSREVFKARNGRDVVGFRLIYGMARRYPQILAWARAYQVPVIHLVRDNLLKKHLSKLTAPLHKMHHPREGARIRTVRIVVDPSEIQQTLDKHEARVNNMRRAIASLPHLEVTYESLIHEQDTVLKDVMHLLGIHDATATLRTDLVKINPDSVRDIVENYDELAGSLVGTPYERFLD
jgi:hypothetical protein